ncbi:MAG: ABC transporter permease [Chloroflexi bacterium]|nr:ABC transporter permease [Chloroflexota bacterium]
MRLFRNLARRRLRTSLTITGITIGIWALVVFSAMANRINVVVAGGADAFAGSVLVLDATSEGTMSFAPMSVSLSDQLAAVPGVARAVPQVTLTLESDGMGMSLGDPGMITAGRPLDDPGGRVAVRAAAGRLLTAEDAEPVVVLGADLARRAGVAVGATMTIRGHDFTVVGILDPPLSPADTTALMPLGPGQQLYAEALPAVIRGTLRVNDLATQVTVIPADGVTEADLAARIEAAVPDVRAVTASSFQESIGSSVALLNVIIVGVALISLVVGGLSVINTMAMSVQERTREIGIKRAIGGSRGRVVRELVGEAALIGAIGGLIGLGLGAAVIWVANEAGRSSGTILFDLTTGTAIQALVFSTLLGMLAGLMPAWSAARLDPVQAIRND